MIVRILSSSVSFHGVSYNTDKIDRGFGELMKMSGFGALQGLQELRPEDYKNELKAISALNKRVKSPQFHAAISAPGMTFDRYQLTAIAEKWLTAMGYAKQPYLIVFHQDTANNHVHIVSTRIDRNGKTIDRDFENIRAVQQLNQVMGIDEKHNVTVDIEKALAYRYATIAQFKMILENQGYVLKEESNQLHVIKFGMKLADLPLSDITGRLAKEKPDAKRTAQIKAILIKYAKIYDTSLKLETVPLPGQYGKPTSNYSSELARCLKEKHGLVLKFHASDDKPPYGYSLIDNAGKAVYKGSEVIPLKELLAIEITKQYVQDATDPKILEDADRQSLDYYGALLRAVLYNYPDIKQGLHHQGLDLQYSGGDIILIDYTANASIPVSDLLNEKDFNSLQREVAQNEEIADEIQRQFHAIPGISLATDMDDEAIHGRKRRRKHKP